MPAINKLWRIPAHNVPLTHETFSCFKKYMPIADSHRCMKALQSGEAITLSATLQVLDHETATELAEKVANLTDGKIPHMELM